MRQIGFVVPAVLCAILAGGTGANAQKNAKPADLDLIRVGVVSAFGPSEEASDVRRGYETAKERADSGSVVRAYRLQAGAPDRRETLAGLKAGLSVTVSVERLRELLAGAIAREGVGESDEKRSEFLKRLAAFVRKDGVVLSVPEFYRADVFPGPRIGPFQVPACERHEYLELALGVILRAKAGHRNSDDGDMQPLPSPRAFLVHPTKRPPSPGVQFDDGGIVVQGGCRAKKKDAIDLGPFGNVEHFDGTFRLRIAPKVVDGQLACSVTMGDHDFTWTGGLASTDKYREQFRSEVEKQLNAALKGVMDKLASDYPEAKALFRHAEVKFSPAGMTITVKTP